MVRYISLFIILFLLCQCKPKSKVKSLQELHVTTLKELSSLPVLKEVTDYQRPCLLSDSYVPDEFFERRTIRVNVHFMNNTKGDANFSLEAGKKYLMDVLNNANDRLGKNVKMNLPVGNETPVLDPHFRYKVVGIEEGDDGYYYHEDDTHYYFMNKGKGKNNYNKAVVKKYAIRDDSILNIFVISHPQDSLESDTYKAFGTGIALGTSLKISGLYTHRESKAYTFGTLMNHEIGHVLGLAHAWTKYDGCKDTPVHPNCWDKNAPPPCDGTYSNNVMDYNKSQMAYTPCQLSKIHKGFSVIGSKTRGLVYDDWCYPIENDTIYITKDMEWIGNRDLRKDIVIMPGVRLDLHCRLSMAKGRKITVKSGAELHLHRFSELHNSCGDTWAGIEIESNDSKLQPVFVYGKASMRDVEGVQYNIVKP